MSQDNKTNNYESDADFENVVEDNQNGEDIGEDNAIEKNIEPKKKTKKKSFKNKVILVETIILIIVLAAVYLYYNNQSQKINQINESSEKLDTLNTELEYCQNLIIEDQVNPDEYNYCNLLIRNFK
ncbi:MAG TPA: hypothetical protein VJ926_02700 [Patescibacteria group bacterium]|nr:hypothetical protein [Patescibacteria group bacterium]